MIYSLLAAVVLEILYTCIALHHESFVETAFRKRTDGAVVGPVVEI